MLAPFFALFFIFTILPVLTSMFFSFTFFNMLEMPQFVGWVN
jgi:multiple sugar transport system permease protein